jgi:signal transduction histidine kinase
MGPFEFLWLTIFFIFILIAFARGYGKELGTTTLIFVALFLITYLAVPRLPGLINESYRKFFHTALPRRQMEHLLASGLSLTFIAIVFASYAGDTFTFKGKSAKGMQATLYTLLVGAMNGYLISGTLWYFQDNYRYPIADLGVLQLPLTQLGEQIANYLPPYVVPPAFWAILVAIMLIFKVRK